MMCDIKKALENDTKQHVTPILCLEYEVSVHFDIPPECTADMWFVSRHGRASVSVSLYC